MTTEEQRIDGQQLIPQDTRAHMLAVLDHLATLNELSITTDEEYVAANEVVTKLKADKKGLIERRQELTKPYKDKATAIEAAIRPVLDALDNGARRVADGMVKYHTEQERKRFEEQRKKDAEAEAKRKAEQEKAEAEQRKAEQYREQGRDDLAAKAEARADTHLDKAVTTVAQTVETLTKPKGSSYVETWEATITDKAKAVTALMAQPTTAQFITIDLKKLEALQRGFKGEMQVEGIEFRKTYQLRNRAA